MRKLLLLSFLIIAIIAHARQISEGEAASIASEFLNSAAVRQTPAKAGVRRAKAPNAANAEAAPFYVYNADDNKGFVIISGDDRAKRIVGYSDKGSFSFDNLPPQLNAMLKQYEEQIKNIPANTATHESWKASTRVSEEGGVLLETANWGQGAPYNSLCPIIDGVQAPTGCVATAMAIVMKYHNWPEGYDWNSMPMTQPKNTIESLSKLMVDAGKAVFMNYGAYESGANVNWIGHRLQYIFKYSPDCQYITSANFSYDEWTRMLKDNIDNNKPVIYSGTSDVVGHAFIIDGYKDDVYHINWGWDGLCNGYYALDALTPNETQDYSSNTGMIINIVPDKSGTEYSEGFTDYGYLWAIKGDLGESMNLSVENVKKGEPFHVMNTLYTLSPGFEGLVGVALVDKNNVIKEVLQTNPRSTWSDVANSFVPMGMGDPYLNLVVNSEIDPTDKIQLVTKRNDEDEYKIMLGTLEWPSYVMVSDNTPRYGKVKWIIGEGIQASYLDTDMVYKDIESGESELSVLRGFNLGYKFSLADENTDNQVHVSVRGPLIYGDENYTQSVVQGAVSIVGDYTIEAKQVVFNSESIDIEVAGALESLISKEKAPTVRELAVTGHMNAIDFWYIRDNFSGLKKLDLSGVIIDEVEASDSRFFETSTLQSANTIPEWALTALQNIKTLILPESIIGIASNSLQDMSISSITIPAGVSYIGLNALYGNQNLEVVTLLNPTPIEINDCVFTETRCPKNGYLFVPDGSLESYKNAGVWKDFLEITEGIAPSMAERTLTIDNVVYECKFNRAEVVGYEGEIKKIVIPPFIEVDGVERKVTTIAERAFQGCGTMETLDMSDNITEIGTYAFYDCTSLKKVILSKNLTKINAGAFCCCFNLEQCELTDNITTLGAMSFYMTGIKSVHIPKFAEPESRDYIFNSNYNLKEFSVEEGNKVFKAINGVLYRITDSGLELESVPCLMEGILTIPDECDIVRTESFVSCAVTDVIFNPTLSVISNNALYSATGVRHVSLPLSASIYPQAIYACDNLESITFTGLPKRYANMAVQCKSLRNIIMANETEIINLDNAFTDIRDELNIFTRSLNPNFSYSQNANIYIPGATNSNYNQYGNVKEMWKYEIDRAKGRIKVEPLIDGVVIDGVSVNGNYQKVNTDGIYYFDAVTYSGLNVDVEYTLHDRQPMTTHYDAQFNAAVPDADLTTGVNDITVDTENINDVYNIQGICIRRNATQADIDALPAGIYIINGRKVVVN